MVLCSQLASLHPHLEETEMSSSGHTQDRNKPSQVDAKTPNVPCPLNPEPCLLQDLSIAHCHLHFSRVLSRHFHTTLAFPICSFSHLLFLVNTSCGCFFSAFLSKFLLRLPLRAPSSPRTTFKSSSEWGVHTNYYSWVHLFCSLRRAPKLFFKCLWTTWERCI